MEYTPTVVFSSLNRDPEEVDKYNKDHETLNMPQEWNAM
jgi:hypothetical protein